MGTNECTMTLVLVCQSNIAVHDKSAMWMSVSQVCGLMSSVWPTLKRMRGQIVFELQSQFGDEMRRWLTRQPTYHSVVFFLCRLCGAQYFLQQQ